MSRFILIDGDKANFIPAFGKAIVTVKPGNLKASGKATLKGKKVCVDGDEKKLSVPGCMYISPPYVIPGTGTLKIESLGPDQKAMKTNTGGKKVLLQGSIFKAKFEVQSPAQEPPKPPAPPVPDPMKQYSGMGNFTTTNKIWLGT
ncbi:MAG: hypothetical protein F6K48_21150 [Okeania sp. SIO3H1]|uniref:hypothetical protein n=1 Tax=Okeania sp. SIO1I7 TaxID=2607772 RepID=UPI0013CA423E|nr:hypothetical protein [Okeania sp. SIO1I7]NEN91276.1 hypothetical protein [Okeania sp. SIO3H1]NET28637.1 hypothetical protein [Okeania sp. SIO1I7]